MIKQNYYKLLDVDITASPEEIKKAYRQKAIRYHPDKNPNNRKEALEKFRKINEAYNILMDPKLRAEYDRTFIKKPDRNRRRAKRSTFFEIKEILNTIFTKDRIIRSRNHRPTRGFDIRQEITITLSEAALGCEKIIKMNYDDVYDGYYGYNIINRTKEIRIKIYPGIKDGTCLKIGRQGGTGINGGTRGDLYVTVRIQPDKFLTRKDDDIHYELKLDFVSALLGTKMKIPTVEGKVEVSIPPCTQPNQTFRLIGKGFPKANGQGRGDQLVTVKVVFPNQITSKQRELLKQFYN